MNPSINSNTRNESLSKKSQLPPNSIKKSHPPRSKVPLPPRKPLPMPPLNQNDAPKRFPPNTRSLLHQSPSVSSRGIIPAEKTTQLPSPPVKNSSSSSEPLTRSVVPQRIPLKKTSLPPSKGSPIPTR